MWSSWELGLTFGGFVGSVAICWLCFELKYVKRGMSCRKVEKSLQQSCAFQITRKFHDSQFWDSKFMKRKYWLFLIFLFFRGMKGKNFENKI